MFDFLRRRRQGDRFIESLLTGAFDDSPGSQQFEAWFRERPQRAAQRDLFVEVLLGLGGPRGMVAERLLDSIMKAWRGEAGFGESLAAELEEQIVFDPPQTDEQSEFREAGVEKVQEFKARLRALDE